MTRSSRFARRVAALTTLLVLPAFLALAQPSPKTPTETYLGYRASLLKAKSLDEVRPWLSRDGLLTLNSMPADQRAMMLEMIQDMSSAVTNLKIVKETVTGDKAELRVEATDTGDKSVAKAMVEIVREGGVWKFVKESWGDQ